MYYVYIYIYIYIYTYIYIYIYIHVYTFTYTCVYNISYTIIIMIIWMIWLICKISVYIYIYTYTYNYTYSNYIIRGTLIRCRRVEQDTGKQRHRRKQLELPASHWLGSACSFLSQRLLAQQKPIKGLNLLTYAWKAKGTASSKSRFQTVLVQRYSANLSPSGNDYLILIILIITVLRIIILFMYKHTLL